jgi:hypothetical protein
MTEYSKTTLHLAVGDIITSKKGILQYSDLSGEYCLMFKGEYLGNRLWRAIKKEECDAECVDKEPTPSDAGGVK